MDNLPRERDLPDTDPPRQMWKTYSPIALFASAQDANNQGNHLVPVAIQMDFKPGLVYPSFDPVYTSVHKQLSSKILLVAGPP